MRKVAIVGTADTSRDLAPYQDPEWEIWTLGVWAPHAARCDRVFEVHSLAILERDAESLKDEFNWFRNNQAIEVWMAEPADWVPMAREFPTDTLLKEFGGYFTNSVSWMIALAIYEGVDELALYGVDMAHGTEYAAQRPSCEYYVGLARGQGIPVFIPEQSDLLKCAEPYGLEKSPLPLSIINRMHSLQSDHAEFTRREQEAILNKVKIEGALEILQYVQAAWMNPGLPSSVTNQESN